MMKALQETVVLVTGASGAIGRAIAWRFAEVGMTVVIHYNESIEGANETARGCVERGAKTLIVRADLSKTVDVLRMHQLLIDQSLSPDIIVHNSGISHVGLLTDMTEVEWDHLFAVNTKSAFLLSKHFVPQMIQRKYGRLIFLSSIWGLSGASCEVAYSASKGAINSFAKALAKELAPSQITVNAVAPGAVDTPMLNNLGMSEKQDLQDDIPAGRFAHPAEIAALVYFLALPESSYITGQIISPNGGWLT
jgi:3-oxoacyl-[acyl-carrier protein] reductase